MSLCLFLPLGVFFLFSSRPHLVRRLSKRDGFRFGPVPMEFTRNDGSVVEQDKHHFSRLAFIYPTYVHVLGFREFIKVTYKTLGHYQLLAVPYNEKYSQSTAASKTEIDHPVERRPSMVEKIQMEPRMSLRVIDDTLVPDQSSTQEIHVELTRDTDKSTTEQFASKVDVHRPPSSIDIPYIPIPPLPDNYVNANLPVNIRILHSYTTALSPPSKSSWFSDKYVEVEVVPLESSDLTDGATSSEGLIVYLHGGGFVSMTSFSHEMYTRKWAIDTGNQVLCGDCPNLFLARTIISSSHIIYRHVT
jgi:hypothetical protein